jgi:hypothetical protein
MMSGGDNGSSQAARQEQERQNVVNGDSRYVKSLFDGQFTDDFFNKRQQAYLDYANPQLQDQYGKAKQALTFNLADNGTLNSSTRAQQQGQLQKLFDTNQRAVNDQAVNTENSARDAVNSAETGLLNQISSTGYQQGSIAGNDARISWLSTPDTYSPLGDLFGGFTSALKTQSQLEAAAALSGGLSGKPAISLGLFGPSKSAVSNN